MCSRYFLDADGNVIAYTFRVPPQEVRSRFNIAPTQEAPVIRMRSARDAAPEAAPVRELATLRWGLVPPWAKEVKVGTRMINARSEEAPGKPAFREAMKARRCIVPASGFYEWRGEPGRKQPFAITLPGVKVFAFAGLWERWKPSAGGEAVETFAILTTDANEEVARIHDRMPVILPRDSVDAWLAGPAAEAAKLLAPYAGPISIRAVGRYVSNVNHEGPECLSDAEPDAWAPPPSASGQGSLF